MAKKVLVVDDDPNLVRFLSVALEENGYIPIGAFDGKEGWEKACTELPDLFFLDVMMPKRTGFTLFKQLRKDERFKDTPVIMLTGVTASLATQDDASDDTMEQPYGALRESLRKVINEMKEDGVVKPDLFIEKPVDPEDVVEKVKELIGE
jgi:DNA-binding response OmpR family regulator